MLTELRKRIDEHSENFNKEQQNMKENQSELKNTVLKLFSLKFKNTIF